MSDIKLFDQNYINKESGKCFKNHIIIDVTRVVRRLIKKQTLTGIDRVTLAYVDNYKQKAQALVRWCGLSCLLSQKQSKNLFEHLINRKPLSSLFIIQLIIKGSFNKSPCKSSKIHSTQNSPLNYQNVIYLLNTGHLSLKSLAYERLQRKYNINLVFFVHDLIPITYPEYCNIGEDIRHQQKINYILTHAQGIITNSNVTLSELNNYAKKNNYNMPRAKSALLASNFSSFTTNKRPIEKPYFVILSTIEPRKNHILILTIWRSLFSILGANTPQLLIIGRRGWECENVLDLLNRSPSLKECVTEISSCNDSSLVKYLTHCQALLFPSFIEGYGLPLIEALSLNVPIIASDLPVFREIAGDIPEYRDPLDGLGWKEIILKYSKKDSFLRKKQLKRIEMFKKPTWAEHFFKVEELLEFDEK